MSDPGRGRERAGAATAGITFELPGALQPYAGGSTEVVIDRSCATLAEAISALAERSPGVVDRMIDELGAVRPHVNIFVDGESIRFLAGLDTPVTERSTIVVVPAVSGG
ncbi:MAG TPA: MoaD/ThiS family protein [Gemmatimonadaceae bacterium]|nr:MoaD/ThiS family protein [Gemmatimonadaceae bacterium]